MEEYKLLLKEEGREARNLLASHVSAVNRGFIGGKVTRKPPCPPTSSQALKEAMSLKDPNNRRRSASTDRDKRTELRARCWGLLFGNLQRSIAEIYNTVESHQSMIECQEVALVLENYLRDFNALAEWYRLKWDLEKTPFKYPSALTWDISKIDMTKSNKMNTATGKISPSSSSSGKLSPRMIRSQSNIVSPVTDPQQKQEAIVKTAIVTETAIKSKAELDLCKESFNAAPEREGFKTLFRTFERGTQTGEKESKTAEKGCQTGEKERPTGTKVSRAVQKDNQIVEIERKPLEQEKRTVAKGCQTGEEESKVNEKGCQTGEMESKQVEKGCQTTSKEIEMIEQLNQPATEKGCQTIDMKTKPMEKEVQTIEIENKPIEQDSETIEGESQQIEKGNETIEMDSKLENGNQTVELERKPIQEDQQTVEMEIKLENENQTIEIERPQIENENETIEMDSKLENGHQTVEMERKPIQEDKQTVEMESKLEKENRTGGMEAKAIEEGKETVEMKNEPMQKKNQTIVMENKFEKEDQAIEMESKPFEEGSHISEKIEETVKVSRFKDVAILPFEIPESRVAKEGLKLDLKAVPTNEKAYSPSEDYQTYDCIRKVGVISAEVGTSTDEYEMEPLRDDADDSKRQTQVTKPISTLTATSGKTPTTSSNVKSPIQSATKLTTSNNKTPPGSQVALKTSNTVLKPSKPAYSAVLGAKQATTVKPPIKQVVQRTVKPTVSSLAKTVNRNIQPLKEDFVPLGNRNKQSTRRRMSGGITFYPTRTFTNKSLEQKASKPTLSASQPIQTGKKGGSIGSSADTLVDPATVPSSVETLCNVPASSTEALQTADGWCTVKTRSRCNRNLNANEGDSKTQEKPLALSSWATRFHTVSGTASLPTLVLLQGEEQGDGEAETVAKSDKHAEKGTSGADKKQRASTAKPSNRTKRPSTAFKKEKNAAASKSNTPRDAKPQRTALVKSQTIEATRATSKTDNSATIEADSAALSHCSTNENNGFKSDLDDSVHNSDDAVSVLSSISVPPINDNEELDEVDEEHYTLRLDSQEDLICEEEHQLRARALTEEEERLNFEIQQLNCQETDADDTETDGTETDGDELQCDEDDDNATKCEDHLDDFNDLNDISLLEARYEPMLAGMSWGDRVDALATIEQLVARHPGRALKLHQKLSNPARRSSLSETLRKYQAKQARAQQRRQDLQREKALKLQALFARVEDVKTAKQQLIEAKRRRMEIRLKRAAEKRKEHLKSIVQKAHDEEEKKKEIAFINELEAQNRKHDFMVQYQEHSVRIRGMQEDRKKRLEEKAAKEAAVEERRRAIERVRLERLDRLEAERRKKNERVDQRQQRREMARQEMAREKARDREERLSALHAHQLATTQQLQKRIEQKQEEYARRHEENMEQIRQRALELSIRRCATTEDNRAPNITPYAVRKICKTCNVLIKSEVYLISHLRGLLHQESIAKNRNAAGGEMTAEEIEQYNLSQIIDAPSDKQDSSRVVAQERGKAYKKRCRKIRQRMEVRGADYESTLSAQQEDKDNNNSNSNKDNNNSKKKLRKTVPSIAASNRDNTLKRAFLRSVNAIRTLSEQAPQGLSAASLSQLDRNLNSLCRTLTREDAEEDIREFREIKGFSALEKLLLTGLMDYCSLSPRNLIIVCNLWRILCKDTAAGHENSDYVILSNRLLPAFDLLDLRLQKLKIVEDTLPTDLLATTLMQLLVTVLNNVTPAVSTPHMKDIISFAVTVGIVQQLTNCCLAVRSAVDQTPDSSAFLLASLDFLAALCHRCPTLEAGETDSTNLTSVLHGSEFMGIVSMLYGTLLPPDSTSRVDGQPPTPIPRVTLDVAVVTFRLLKRIAEIDLKRFQATLGAEGISLQFRHIASHLIWSCAGPSVAPASSVSKKSTLPTPQDYKLLLHEVMRVIGYFTLKHHDNQMLLVSGQSPSVLEQLCKLPFPYFCEDRLSASLFPTLLACCSNNEHTKKILGKGLSYQMLERFRETELGRQQRLVKMLD